MAPRVYIDGHAGTTGLRIRDWMEPRADVELLVAPMDRRKDPEVRRGCIAEADLVVLCLPDEAAREAALWAKLVEKLVVALETRRSSPPGAGDFAKSADPVALLKLLFGGGLAPIAPFPDCGPGMLPVDAQLGCANPPDCQ